MINKIYFFIRNILFSLLYTNTNKIKFKYRGKNVLIENPFTYYNSENISIGDNSSIGMNNIFYATLAEITIGNYVIFAPYVMIFTGDHRTDNAW